jgi:hypothetical protein
MSRAQKKLETALKKTAELPDSWFGNIEASIQELPSIQGKRDRVRKNIYVDKKTAEILETISEKNGVSFTDIANDILTRFVSKGKK